MAVRPVAIFVAEGVALDVWSARLSAFNITDIFRAPTFPAYLYKIAVVVMYEGDGQPEEFRERATLVAPGGATVIANENVLRIGAPTYHSIHMLWNIQVAAAGSYALRIERAPIGINNWTEVGHRRVVVEQGIPPLYPGSLGTQQPAPASDRS